MTGQVGTKGWESSSPCSWHSRWCESSRLRIATRGPASTITRSLSTLAETFHVGGVGAQVGRTLDASNEPESRRRRGKRFAVSSVRFYHRTGFGGGLRGKISPPP